jgi:hypothetical protein
VLSSPAGQFTPGGTHNGAHRGFVSRVGYQFRADSGDEFRSSASSIGDLCLLV